jgi:hypothetical protein
VNVAHHRVSNGSTARGSDAPNYELLCNQSPTSSTVLPFIPPCCCLLANSSVLVPNVPPQRVFATTNNIAQRACVHLPLVRRVLVSPHVALTAERLTTLAANPAFLLFPGFLRCPRSRCSVARGCHGAFKLQLLDSHREIHIDILALPT